MNQPKVIGYVRTATKGHGLDLQKENLAKAGCEVFFEDVLSGLTLASERPGLSAALTCLCEGDTLMVHNMARLSRSFSHLVEIVHELQRRGVSIKSIH